MSDNWVIVVPEEPTLVPERERLDAAALALRTLASGAEEVKVIVRGHPEFIDAGGNWAGVKCPGCHADLEEWWSGAVNAASARQFVDLTVVTPCCGLATSLNALEYPWQVAFASVSIGAMNPGVRKLDAVAIGRLAESMACPIRIVYQHF